MRHRRRHTSHREDVNIWAPLINTAACCDSDMRTSYSPCSCPLLSLFLVPLFAAASNLWTFFAFQYLYLAFFFLEIHYGQGTRWGGILGNRSSSLYFKRSLQSLIEYSSQKPNNSMCNGFRLSLSGKKTWSFLRIILWEIVAFTINIRKFIVAGVFVPLWAIFMAWLVKQFRLLQTERNEKTLKTWCFVLF